MLSYRRADLPTARISFGDRFGIRSIAQVKRDMAQVLKGTLDRDRFQAGISSLGLLRPDLSLPAYAGWIPSSGRSPIFNLFDRVRGGLHYSQRTTRVLCRDFRGGRLTYDEHDGTDFVCPVQTEVVAAAPGTVVLIRDRWLRGGLTLGLDHGQGLITQYTHLTKTIAELMQPVERGEVIALSGSSGYDMFQFFPWVPPHIHFMVWHCGTPVDPFLTTFEKQHSGVWRERNDPRPSGPLPDDPRPTLSAVDEERVERAIAACIEPEIREEMEQAGPPAVQAAFLEDALHHDAWAWPKGFRVAVRPPTDSDCVLTLPLSADQYMGIVMGDAFFTKAG